MDITTKAIALKSTDLKESDKIILLYSLEYGKISVHARGIKKANAKLKFCADQFCFGQYELAKTNDRYVLKTCQQLESFYSLREDVEVYYSACAIAECLINYTQDELSEPNVFVETLKALQTLLESNADCLLVVLRFILAFLQMEGLQLAFDSCCLCQKQTSRMFLDLQRGGTVCENCRTLDSILVPPATISMCKLLSGMPYEKLKNLNFTRSQLKETLTLCYKYISHSFFPLKTLSELIKLA